VSTTICESEREVAAAAAASATTVAATAAVTVAPVFNGCFYSPIYLCSFFLFFFIFFLFFTFFPHLLSSSSSIKTLKWDETQGHQKRLLYKKTKKEEEKTVQGFLKSINGGQVQVKPSSVRRFFFFPFFSFQLSPPGSGVH